MLPWIRPAFLLKAKSISFSLGPLGIFGVLGLGDLAGVSLASGPSILLL